jgi:hypothetical protein
MGNIEKHDKTRQDTDKHTVPEQVSTEMPSTLPNRPAGHAIMTPAAQKNPAMHSRALVRRLTAAVSDPE